MEKWKIGSLIGFVIVWIWFLYVCLTTYQGCSGIVDWTYLSLIIAAIGGGVGKLIESGTKTKKVYVGLVLGGFFGLFLFAVQIINTGKIISGESRGLFLILLEKVFFFGFQQNTIWNIVTLDVYIILVILFWILVGAIIGYLIDKFTKKK